MLVHKRVDYILINRTPAFLYASQMSDVGDRVKPVGRVSMDGFWVACSKSHPQGVVLVDALNRGLAALKANGRLDAMLTSLRQRIGFR
jgi:polar amino acid transport system substrate-binding protein